MAKKLLRTPAPARALPTAKAKKKSDRDPNSYWSGLNEIVAAEELELMPQEVHGIRRASIRKRIF